MGRTKYLSFLTQLEWRRELVEPVNEGNYLRVIPKGWIDKKVWRQINDILGLKGFYWVNNGREKSCWIRSKQQSLLEFCN